MLISVNQLITLLIEDDRNNITRITNVIQVLRLVGKKLLLHL